MVDAVTPGCSFSVTIASFCSSLNKRPTDAVGGDRSSITAVVSLSSVDEFLVLALTTCRGRGKMRAPVDLDLAAGQSVTSLAQRIRRQLHDGRVGADAIPLQLIASTCIAQNGCVARCGRSR
jgi:hypothetical protein